MSTPSTPRSPIPIIKTEFLTTGPARLTPEQLAGGPVQYRIEEHRRTIYVTTSGPQPQWNSQAMSEIFKLADMPESPGNGSLPPRSKSFEDRDTLSGELRKGSGKQGDRKDSPMAKHGPRLGHSKHSSLTNLLSPIAHNTPPNTPANNSPESWTLVHNRPPAILFYHRHEPHYGFTNFSAHPVMYKGKRYPTSEHLFQSFKFQDHRPNLAEHIRTCSERPSMAFSEARRFQPEVRADWKDVNIEKMDETLWHKFTQHQDLKEELLATGEAELVENSDKDAFWGIGADGTGKNELGKALERLRAKLRKA